MGGQNPNEPAHYVAYVRIGSAGKESFHFTENGDWDEVLTPEEGMWTIGAKEEDDARPDDVFKIIVEVWGRNIMNTYWRKANREEMQHAAVEGCLLSRG